MTDSSEIKAIRTMLRRIEEHRLLTQIERGVVCETVNMVDVIHHPSDVHPALNYITPRRSAAWVSAAAAREGLARLAELDRAAYVIYLEGLMMPIFRQTLTSIGLEWAQEDALYTAVVSAAPAQAHPTGDDQPIPAALPPAASAVIEDAHGLARWWSGWRALRYEVLAPGASAALVQASAGAVKTGTQVYCLIRDLGDRPRAAGRLDVQAALGSAEIDRFEAQDADAAQTLMEALKTAAAVRGCDFIFAACGSVDTLLAAQLLAGWTLAGKCVHYHAPAAPPHRTEHDHLAQSVHSG